MRNFKLLFVGLISIVAFTTMAVAQAKKMPLVSLIKVALVNTIAFEDEKTGIRDLAAGYDKVLNELKPKYDELQSLSANLREIAEEISRYNDLARKDWTGHSGYYSKAKSKFEEYKILSCKYREKADDYKELLEERKFETINPIIVEIADALQQFAKQNDYTVVLDSSQKSLFIKIDRDAIDITNEFILFYNEYSRKEKTQ